MPRPIHFEIVATNPEKIVQFYSGLFGWEFSKWDGPQEYWLIRTGQGPGIDGGMLRRREGSPNTVNILDVPDIDDSIKRIEAAGGTTVVPKMPIPGVGHLAYCKDPEGTIFGIMQNDPSAA